MCWQQPRWTQLYQARRLTTSIQSPCVAITARVDAISLSGPALWLEFKKLSVVCCMDPYYKEGENQSLCKSLVITIAIQPPLKTVYRVIVYSVGLMQSIYFLPQDQGSNVCKAYYNLLHFYARSCRPSGIP